MKEKHWIAILLTVIFSSSFFSLPVSSADLNVSASVDKTVVGLNQQFTLSIDISGDKANAVSGEPRLPDISAFATYLGSSGTSSSIQIINGRMSVSKTFSYAFLATKVGRFEIGPAEVEFKGKIYKTQPFTIEIISAPSHPPLRRETPSVQAEDTITGNLFLKASVSKGRVYQNEPVILIYKIYTRVNVTSYGISKLPNTVGFWAEEFPLQQPPPTTEEVLDGRKFVVAEIKKMALFPTNPGTKTIDPMKVECDVRLQARRKGRDFFDSFFDNPFFRRTVRQVISSEPITIEVLPLPEVDRPTDFSGAVGKYSISASVDKNMVKTNEAISLKVRIAGSGNIKMLPQPKVEIPSDFEKYEPKVSEKVQRKGNTISGSKTFEYVLIPRFPGRQKIRPIAFSYFDIGTKTYKTLTTPELEINVKKQAEEFLAIGPGLSKQEVKLLGQDIRFIEKSIPGFKRTGEYFYKSTFFIVLLILPVFLVVGSIGYRRHLDKLSQNVAYARSRKANQMAMSQLRKAQKLMDEKTQKEFYAEVNTALLGFLGDKLNIASAGIVTDQVEDMLRLRNIDGQIVSQYMDCLRTCDYQRFAPTTAKNEEMRAFLEQARKSIVDLEKVI